MQTIYFRVTQLLVLVVAGILAASPALADKSSWNGGGKEDRKERKSHDDKYRESGHDNQKSRAKERHDTEKHEHFGDRQREAAHEYYAEQLRTGSCPPGLAKKRNGCLPPGQAKKWKMGQPLPPDLVYQKLPPQLSEKLGSPPTGYRYVRVANDILLIAVGTAMVADAIEDLGNMK